MQEKKSIFYVITYGPKHIRSPLGDTGPRKTPPPKLLKKLSAWKIYHFKVLQPS